MIFFPDPALDFILVTDASLVAEGAVLMQLQNGREKIVGVASRTFTSIEQRWSATEREAHGVLFGIRRFQYFLRGKPFVVKTDHQAFCYIDTVDHKNAKLARWMDELSAYRFVVEYVPGEQNVWADMFSRPFGLKKAAATGTDEPAGKFVEFSDSLKAYIPSWCTKATVSEPTGPSPKLLSEGIARALVCSTAGDFKLSQTADELLQLASSQRADSSLGKLIDALEKFRRDPKSIKLDKNDTHYGIYLRNWSYFRICQRTNVLLRIFEGKRKQV